MKEAVTNVIDTLTRRDFHGAFQKLLERYNKCIAAGGDYFEVDYSFMCILSIKMSIRKKSGNLFNEPLYSSVFYSVYFWIYSSKDYASVPQIICDLDFVVLPQIIFIWMTALNSQLYFYLCFTEKWLNIYFLLVGFSLPFSHVILWILYLVFGFSPTPSISKK